MKTLYLGMDVSKGYADLVILNDAHSVLEQGRFDDTSLGHASVSALVGACLRRTNAEKMLVGVESSGGLEQNWAAMFHALSNTYPLTIYRLNPLIVKRFLSCNLHRNVTDASSAHGIAEYLHTGIRMRDLPFEPCDRGALTLYRTLRNAISRKATIKNELQSLLPRVHPEIVQYCRCSFPRWVLHLLERYPTVTRLARARHASVAKIPYIKQELVVALIANARTSVSSQRDDVTGKAVTFLVEELQRLESTIGILQESLKKMMSDDPIIAILCSIPGIATWSAICLRLEIGRIERFISPEALVAYTGLDPRVHQSGDGLQQLGISKRGRREIRAILYPVICAAIRHNPIIAAFYARLRKNGKGHRLAATAAMRKMLHIVFACWASNRPFDKQYAAAYAQGRNSIQTTIADVATSTESVNGDAATSTESVNGDTTSSTGSDNDNATELKNLPRTNSRPRISAPVSRREAKRREEKRREAETLPQSPLRRSVRGPSTAARREVK